MVIREVHITKYKDPIQIVQAIYHSCVYSRHILQEETPVFGMLLLLFSMLYASKFILISMWQIRIFFILFFKIYLFNWRIIVLQYCDGFCHTSTRISHRYTRVPHILNPSPILEFQKRILYTNTHFSHNSTLIVQMPFM